MNPDHTFLAVGSGTDGSCGLLLQRPEPLLFDSGQDSGLAKHRLFCHKYSGFKPGIVWSDLKHLGTLEYVGQPLLEAVDWLKQCAVTHGKELGPCDSCWAVSTAEFLEGG